MSKTRDELVRRAKELGVPLNSGIYASRTDSVRELEIGEYELSRRISEEERHRREHRLWIVALVSSIAAVASALAAWYAAAQIN